MAARICVVVGGVLGLGLWGGQAPGQCQQAVFTPPTAGGIGVGGSFGNDAAISGDRALVGRYQLANQGSGGAGVVHAYRRIGGVWGEPTTIQPPDPEPFNNFGYRIAIDGEVAAITAWQDDLSGVQSVGSVYVFRVLNGVWTFEAKLVPSTQFEEQRFGTAVAIEGDTLVVGAPGGTFLGTVTGSVYVFERIAGVWQEAARLVTPAQHPSERLRLSVAVADGAVFGTTARRAPYNANLNGTTYVWRRVEGAWALEQELLPPNLEVDGYGRALAAQHNEVVIVGNSANGNAWVWRKPMSGPWALVQTLRPVSAHPLGRYGTSVAFDGENIVVGAEVEPDATGAYVGAVFFHRWDGAEYDFVRRVYADPAASSGGFFGSKLALSDDTLIVPSSGTVWPPVGAVHVFDGMAAEPTDFEVDPDVSYIDVTITFPGLGTFTFHVPIGGWLTAELTQSCSAPVSAQVKEINFDALDNPFVQPVAIGQIQIAGLGARMSGNWGDPGDPADVAGDGSFAQSIVYQAIGAGSWTLLGLPGDDDLSTLPMGPATFNGILAGVDGSRELQMHFPQQSHVMDQGLGLFNPTITFSGFVAASQQPPCPADYNDDGGVDGDDVIAYFADWDNGLIAADFNGDGGVDGDDVIEFFARWDGGC
jgi:hypothetical protein